MPPPPSAGRWRGPATAAAVAVLYVLAGKLGLSFAFIHASASPVWPPAGLALAALLVLGPRLWPAVFAGAFVVNATTAGSIATSLGIAAGNTLEAVVGAALVRRFARGHAALDRAGDVFAFAALAGLLAPAVSATTGVTVLSLGGYAAWTHYGSIWLTWWLGDVAGVLVVAPFLVLWSRDRQAGRLRQHPAEAALLAATTLGVGLVVFGGALPLAARGYPIAFASIPALLWAAFRFGPREASTLIALLATIAVDGTLREAGPFARASANESLLLLQAFLATTSVTILSVSALAWEQRRTAASSRVRERQLGAALDAARLGTWEWTVPTGRVTWSPSLEAIHGLAPGGFGGTVEAFRADIHPEDRAGVEAAIRQTLAGAAHRVEYRIVRPDGGVRWVEGRGEAFFDAAGRPERVVGVCLDVTDRKRADEERAALLAQEQAARSRAEEAERRLHVLGEIARSITASLDLDTVLQRIADGAQALCASDTAAIFLRDEALDAMAPRSRAGPWLDVYDTLRVRAGEGFGGHVMATGRPVRTENYRNDQRGRSRLVEVADRAGVVALMVVPIVIRAEVAGLLYIGNATARAFTDEDERVCGHLAEQAAIAIQNARLFAGAEQARAGAEAASRGKDEFLAMLGHELRNPLGAISNAVHLLARLSPPEGRSEQARQIIERQAQHLGRLVDDLLDVGRATTGKIVLQREALDLADLVRRALAARTRSGPAERHRFALTTEAAWVSADAVRLEQVVTNLVENAVRYTPAGGAIEVAVRREGAQAVLAVRDTGVGIAPDLLPRIFDLFVQGDHTLHRTGGGLGIGLTLVRRLVELHGGSVAAVSDGPARGSCFTVRLPAIEAPASRQSAAAGTPTIAARRVLVVEDNEDSRHMLCQLVQQLGHEVHEAADGHAAVERALALVPDLALVDVGLPGIDGYEVARRIRREPAGRHVRLVALTGYGRPEDRDAALAAGYDVHLVKPVDPQALAALLGGAGCSRG
jgi:PAS domain S-box-containing protein